MSDRLWLRTCQECGYKQHDKCPDGHAPSCNYLNRACHKCKSTALDYGKWSRLSDKRPDRAEGWDTVLVTD